jgi:protein involved in polysaccharide export with SLBB domain
MRIFRTLLSTAVFLLMAVVAYGQLSDQQVISEVRRLQATGASQQQIITQLAAKGVTREQAERIYAEYTAGGATESGQVVSTESRTREVSEPMEQEVIVVQETPSRGPTSVFGKNLFASKNLTFQPSINMPTPENYELGAGDEVIVDIWGNSELTVRQTISPDGYINVPNIGPVYLNGMDVKAASAKLKTAFGRIYSDLRSANPRTFMKMSLGNIRSIKVNIMGEVVLPGTYTLSSFASVFHALYSAGGINDIGSLRNVKVFRKGQLEKQVDVYDYLLSGDSSGDIILKENDIVKVEPYTKRVQITGQVKRPMTYEMLENEPMSRLIEYAGGFTSDAYKKNVQLTRLGTTERKVYTVEMIQYERFELHDGDVVSVGSILDRYENRVTISGAVFRPGSFALDERVRTLKDLVTIAEGPREDAFLGRAILNRENPDLSRTVESVDLGKLLAGEIPDIVLKRNDRLYVMSEDALRQDYTVTLEGEVMNPGTYPYALNMSIEDLIITGGGLRESASLMKVDVARRTRDPLATEESSLISEIFTFTIENGLIIEGKKDFLLQPYDIVAVRRSPGYEAQRRVAILGEVTFPGNYSLTTKDETLSSFIKRAGGLTPTAFTKGAKMTRVRSADEREQAATTLELSRLHHRDSIPVESLSLGATYTVGIDLISALREPGSDADLILRAGDVISIPTMDNVVKISGAVMYPNAVTYKKGMSVADYIKNAGGYAFRARRNRVFVIYMNNTIAKGLGSKVEPGCEIIVPMKPERQGADWGDIVGVTTSVLSVISLTVATLLNVSRINPSN